jgi:hypothetical protein
VVIDLALDVNLLGEETPQHKANQLFYLSRESFRRRQIDELWKTKAATSPKSLTSVLLSDVVLSTVQKELRRQTNQNVEAKEISRLLKATVIRADCLEK